MSADVGDLPNCNTIDCKLLIFPYTCSAFTASMPHCVQDWNTLIEQSEISIPITLILNYWATHDYLVPSIISKSLKNTVKPPQFNAHWEKKIVSD